MSLRVRVVLLACISLAALLGIGWVGHSTMQRLNQQILAATLRSSRSEVLALRAQVTFKKQVQEWKNVLIRGHVAADRTKYWESFLLQEAATRSLVTELLGNLPADSPAQGAALDFLASHREMGEKYRDSLAAFDASGNLAYRESDVLVRGQDRKPTDLFDQIVGQLAQACAAEQTHLESDLQAKTGWFLSLGLLAVGLISGVLLLALSRWVTQPVRLAMHQADLIAGGHLDVRMPATSITELGNLQRALNRMAAQLQAGYATLELTNAELARARDAALETSRLKSQFLANMSHEIRTPLNGVIGMTELLLGTALDDEQRDIAKMAQASGAALLSLVEDVLDFSKIEANAIVLRDEVFDLRTLAEEIALITGPRAHAKDVALGFLIDPAAPPLLRGDPIRIRQVLINLLANAVKFTDHGEIVCRIEPLHACGPEVWMRFEVADTGMGIPEEYQRDIFESFRQVDNSNTRTHGGCGLGLAICKRLVEHMRGKIGVDSEPGHGSCFWFTLPFGQADPQLENPADEMPLPAGLRVMVVDDHAINREVVSRGLTRWLAEVETFASGAAALDRLSATGPPFDLILTDLQMPGMDGIELARRVVALPGRADSKIILLSSVGGVAAIDGRDRELFTLVASKPVMQRALRRWVMAAVAGATLPEHPQQRSAQAPTSKSRILVAEDNLINAKLIAALLLQGGYASDLVANGQLALRQLETTAYDVILMDCQMPVMNGFEATRHIRARFAPGHGPVIIALTANVVAGDREHCLAAGMDDYLPKPVCSATLMDMLDRFTQQSIGTAV